MRKSITFLVCCFVYTLVYSQVKLGNNASLIDAASIFELEHPNKALYVTRVSLTSTADITTVPNPKAGMLVYNSNAAITGSRITVGGVGVYVFNGSLWAPAGPTSLGDWALTGNAGTVDGTDFLGTIDNVPLNFRMNNTRAGRVENTGTSNTGFGIVSLNNITSGGIYNTAIGSTTLKLITTADSLTAVGAGALQNNTDGENSVAVGAMALNANTLGANNTALGYKALASQVLDSGNTVIGTWAMELNNGGKENVAIGVRALGGNTTGDSNTVVGSRAGFFDPNLSSQLNTTGSNNTFIGYKACPLTGSLRFAAALGSMSLVLVNNGFVLGATDPGSGAFNSASGAASMTSAFVGINLANPTQRIDFRNGHIRNRQDVLPTTNLNTGNGVTATSVTAGSSDVRGTIQTNGFNNANGLTVIRVNFQYTCTNPPVVMITAANESASAATWFVTTDVSGFTLSYRQTYSGGASGTSASFYYWVIE